MMKNERPLILISNDDGYQAKGIVSLVDMLKDMADILVCAPDSARSGFSCAFTSTSPLRLKHRQTIDNVDIWSCNGTPVDCVKLAFTQFLDKRKPDLVIGGINHGDNSSVNTHYSGTMGVVMEGCMKGISSVAYSLCDGREDADFSPLRAIIREITAKVLAEGLPNGVCLNVNFPKTKSFNGVKVCRMAHGSWENECVTRRHPLGFEYYWLVGEYTSHDPHPEDTDHWALSHDYVSITPTRVDVTDYDEIERIKGWDLDN